MEAKAKYGFEATQADELSFKKGKTLKILNRDDENWYKAELEGQEGFVPSNYVECEDPLWYKGKIGRREAEELLKQMTSSGSFMQPDGAFVVRKSESDDNGHSLSVKHGSHVQHFKILQEKSTGKYFLWKQKFDSINQLVQYHRTSSVSKHDSQTSILLRDMVEPGQHHAVCKCKALYAFDADDEQELSFKKGDVLDILEKVDSNWWRGELKGMNGLIPSNYVQEI